jgi:hypothetical protein
LDTKAAKAVASGVNSVKKDIVDTTTSHRYIEYQPKEAREKARAVKLDPEVRRIMIANPEAGENVVLHSNEKLNNSWDKFKENSSIFKGLLPVWLIYIQDYSTLRNQWTNPHPRSSLSPVGLQTLLLALNRKKR